MARLRKSALSSNVYYQSFRDSNDSIIITDLSGSILDANPAFTAMFGYAREEVIGRRTSLLKSRHSTKRMYSSMWEQITDPAIGFWKGEMINLRKDGTEIPILLSITPIRDGGRITGYMGIQMDISERREMEEFREIYDAVMRHDLKSPLTGIVSYTAILLEGYAGELSDQQKTYLRKVERGARQLKEIIETSLDMQKIQRGTMKLEKEKGNFMALVRQSVENLAQKAEEKKVPLKVILNGKPASSRGRLDAKLNVIQTQRAIDNLLKNAIEAAPDGTAVTLSASETTTGIEFSVNNQGAPIPEEVQARMFHPFSTYGKRGGTGLGVYGVKLAIEAQKGRVSFKSNAKSGTTFKIVLPE